MAKSDFLKHAASVATYYGFSPLETVLKTYACKDANAQKSPPDIKLPDTADVFGEELASLMKSCAVSDIAKLEHPVQIYHVCTQHGKRQEKQPPSVHFGLTILGVEKSAAEALILRSTSAILKETGIEHSCVHINSVGDRDSVGRFVRELSSYLRKNLNDMTAPSREAFKRDAFRALEILIEKRHPLVENAPRPMQFLSDTSRQHLKEVLEFLETTDTPYEINNELIGNHYSQTLFEIHQHNNTPSDENSSPFKVLARGGRCDDFTRRFFRTRLPAVSIVIEGEERKAQMNRWAPPRPKRPKVYLIQLGSRARLQSLLIIEALRRSRIPLHQAFGNDSLTMQLEEARSLNVPYALIIGQREALDGTIIVRDMNTHAQEIIPARELSDHLKTMHV